MKPDWDKLTAEYEGSTSILIADVDCTAGGKELCNSVGVRGYPSIKTGSPDDLQDYKGGRDLNSLKKHAETLGPSCGPANIDLCDDEKKKQIEEFTALGAEKREAMIKEKDAESEKLEADFKAFTEGLNKARKEKQDKAPAGGAWARGPSAEMQAKYREESAKKDEGLEAIKNSGLGLLKSVHKFAATPSTKSEL